MKGTHAHCCSTKENYVIVIKQKVDEFAKQSVSGHYKSRKRFSKYRRHEKISKVLNTIAREQEKKS